MPGFQVQLTTEQFKRMLDECLDGVMDIFKESRGLAFNRRKAGNIVMKMLVFDVLVESFSRACGEAGETTIADYWGAKALAYAMAGKANQGQSFFKKSRERRTGGKFAEWNQEFYS